MRSISRTLLILLAASGCATTGNSDASRDERRARALEADVRRLRDDLRATDRDMARAFEEASRAVDGLGKLDCAAITAERAAAPADRAVLVGFRLDKPYSLRGRFQAPKVVNGRALHVGRCEVTSP